jgi:hypothetical protein
MTSATAQLNDPHEQFGIDLERSLSLADLIDQAWLNLGETDDAKPKATAELCRLSLEHGRAVCMLLPHVPPSAIALLRPQYESLVRAVWARHAASNADLTRLFAPLTPESQQAAKKLPGVPEMLMAIKGSGPRGAGALLERARARLWDGLNSFIHGGIHPFQRGQDGYPLRLLLDALKNSNAMSVLTLLVLAELTDDDVVMAFVAALHEEFRDILPALEPLDAE